MKKIIAIILVLTFAFALVGCNNSDKIEVATNTEAVENSIIKAPRFSYDEEKEKHTQEKDGVEVKLEGFKNTEKTKIKTIKDAVERALKERTIDSDSTNVYYDAKTKICKVIFSTEGEKGYSQSVYMDKEGKTVMMVYVK